MSDGTIEIRGEADSELDSFLGDRLYEFNSSTTGIDDGRLMNASITNDRGEIVAGISGHTWGETCEISRLWVHDSLRGQGVGTRLVRAFEEEAVRRGCTQVVLHTHSFQAPIFYEGLGYSQIGTIPNYPKGYEQFTYLKDLQSGARGGKAGR